MQLCRTVLPQVVNYGNKLGGDMSDWEIAKTFKRPSEFSAGFRDSRQS